MAKFYGAIGYGYQEEVAPGIWELQVEERPYKGDVVRTARKLTEGESVNDDLTVMQSISIVSDAFADQHFFAIKYVRWAGTLWIVNNVDVQSPRLVLRLGGVYHGPTPSGAPGTP